MRYNGAKIVLDKLKDNGVDTIFGYPGGAVIPLYDELYKFDKFFTHIRTSHEQGAVHAADGYARSTGKVGVCFVTSGPGATNTITGLATAYMDSVPLVVFSGQVPSSLLGKDSFQEVDITGITMSVTKYNYIVRDTNNLASVIDEAFSIASSGRPGPVLIDVPKDIFINEIEYINKKFIKEDNKFKKVSKAKIDQAIKLLSNSTRPVIYAGGGITLSESSKELNELINKCNIPVLNTLMGLGSVPRISKLSLGLVGMHGSVYANKVMNNADLIISIGARFSDRVIGNPKEFGNDKKIIQIDVDKTEMNKNVEVDLTLLGDVKHTISEILRKHSKVYSNWWIKYFEEVKDVFEHTDFSPKTILEEVNAKYPNALVATDVGQHQLWTAQYWKFNKTRSFMTSGGLGTMGYGLGSAIGVKIGNRDKDVVLITGDGSFRMNFNELASLNDYGIKITIVLMKNNSLGMVRQWQNIFKDKRYSETCIEDNLNYEYLAKAFNLNSYKCSDSSELNNALEDSNKKEKSSLIVCNIFKDECVLPIVPPGKGVDDIIVNI
ncbi:biosynthetic-type acetolactate synthase large subunit [Helicovermis profundi]|uniref:Acetolactate synthase n=1 Tax=Helicovermis profundi TaxID=3065157 RepID=A0AAU9EFS5_9FIRM|nr:biosynthetic-type acetolactate synthase large subunit [Clostridia bacterium S502]